MRKHGKGERGENARTNESKIEERGNKLDKFQKRKKNSLSIIILSVYHRKISQIGRAQQPAIAFHSVGPFLDKDKSC